MIEQKPNLFGLANSNRDFSIKESWGKNQFNSSFPTALCCYLYAKGINAIHLKIENGNFCHSELPIEYALGIKPDDSEAYFAFEAAHSPFQKYVIGTLPRTDLVIQNKTTGQCLTGIEIKLTALPDNTTCELHEDQYGSEIVVRPDTIVYLVCSLANGLDKNLYKFIDTSINITDWTDARLVIPHIGKIVNCLTQLSKNIAEQQSPFLLQSIWKTKGKSPKLSENCLDVFFWSNAAFLNFITEIANFNNEINRINRHTRTVIWIYKMFIDLLNKGKFNHHQIIDALSYNTKNDKAFAASGKVTHKFMACNRLTAPIINKNAIKNIILGGGQNILSPERRFDAIIVNSPELFA
ncbi:restriction endonuclease HindVP [Achromatium sp. WMS3]|nr:restriction endonuclease HindVP [Achromatium sp. WMS3]